MKPAKKDVQPLEVIKSLQEYLFKHGEQNTACLLMYEAMCCIRSMVEAGAQAEPVKVPSYCTHPKCLIASGCGGPCRYGQPAQPCVPNGWPTKEMVTAFADVFSIRDQKGTFAPAFRAALAAAPSLDSPESKENQ